MLQIRISFIRDSGRHFCSAIAFRPHIALPWPCQAAALREKVLGISSDAVDTAYLPKGSPLRLFFATIATRLRECLHIMTHASLPDRQGDFVKLLEYDVEFAPIKVVKWKSQRTGLNVIWASTPGPLIHTWTTVVTEIFNSSGIPHTLEHLTFMGSEQ